MLNRWKEINNNALFAFDSMWNQPHWIVFAKRWCEESREAETAVEWVWPSNSGRVLEIVMSIMLIHLHCNITTCSATAWSNDEPVIRANHHLSSMCVCVCLTKLPMDGLATPPPLLQRAHREEPLIAAWLANYCTFITPDTATFYSVVRRGGGRMRCATAVMWDVCVCL